MGRAVQTPFREGDASAVGPHLFRKQLLPVAQVEHAGRTLDFTEDYLKKLATNFAAGNRDQVPFVLVDDENKHTDDPEKYRGEVKGVEVAGDGVYVTLDLSEDGAKLIRDNPKLGISARIDETDPDNPQLEHVAGTLSPVIGGMKPWERVSLSDSERSAEVIDLSGESYSDPVAPTDKLSETERDQVAVLARKDPDGVKDALATGGMSDEDVETVMRDLLDTAERETEDETSTTEPPVKREPIAALSETDRKRIDLAERRANDAADEARAARADLATERFERKRDELIHAGVPPHIVNLAEPVLKGEKAVVELSNGRQIDAGATISEILDNCKGMIDFSVIGAGDGEPGTVESEAKQIAERWAEQQTGKRSRSAA